MLFLKMFEKHSINSHNDSLGMIAPEGGKGSCFCFLFCLQDIASGGRVMLNVGGGVIW